MLFHTLKDPNEAVVVQSFLGRIRFSTYKGVVYISDFSGILNFHSHTTFLNCSKIALINT